MIDHPLNDAMPARALKARWVICGILKLDTALHLGGEQTESVDMRVLLDPRSGTPLLPGTTLAGALRSALADRLAGYGEDEPPEVAVLFGASRGVDEGSQSPLIVFDARGKLPEQQSVEIRDGVAISAATGVAEDHKKYDYEVLPAKTTFNVRVDLLVPGPRENGVPPEEKTLLETLALALDAFGKSSLGAKRSRGLGRVGAVWTAQRYDLGSSDGWLAWLRSKHEQDCPANTDQSSIHHVIEAAAPDVLRPLSLPSDPRKRVVIELNLEVPHDILIRSPGTGPDAPDVSHIQSGGEPILPGTSLAGVMRSQALRIARLVRPEDADDFVVRLFGPRFEGQRPLGALKPHASRLRVGEARLESREQRRQTRIAIDRFTHGVVDGALFDEQTEVGGKATVDLELRNPEKGQLGLVLLVLKDLLDGSLPVGGASNVGRGVFKGSATVTWYDGPDKRAAEIEPGKAPTGDAAGDINKAIDEFRMANAARKAGGAS